MANNLIHPIHQAQIPLENRTALPFSVFPMDIQLILDNVSSPILILDNDFFVRFFNTAYSDMYVQVFEKIYGMAGDQLINTKLNELSNAHASHDSFEMLRSVITTRKPVYGTFFQEDDTDYVGFANILPIDLPDFSGIIVIQDESERIERISQEILKYKHLLTQLGQTSVVKDKLPLHFQNITGVSASFVKILQQGAQVAATDSSVCIFGESGTGKEVFANAVHYTSPFSEGPFIKVNCSAIPEALIESELFGYEKGSFTGADPHGKAGKFELADKGTLFLDEIGELPLSMQAKLLRAIQEHEITRIGGKKPIKLTFRLITATNRNLEKMVAEGTFREDLYYRICIIPINLPPLRERRDDIRLLAEQFLSDLTEKSPVWKTRSFSSGVLNAFYRYDWPGNIRELRNCVERMAVFSTTEIIEDDVLPKNIVSAIEGIPVMEQENNEKNYNLKYLVDELERSTIQSVLSMTKGNKIKAIRILGVSSRTFYAKLEKFGLK